LLTSAYLEPSLLQMLQTDFLQQVDNLQEQFQRTSCGIFIGFPENSAGLFTLPNIPSTLWSPAMPILTKASAKPLSLTQNPLPEPPFPFDLT
jgi:hypothetical protein